MTLGSESDEAAGPIPREEAPTLGEAASAPVSRKTVVYEVSRSTVATTWDWLWKDTLSRVAPLAAAALLYVRLAGNPGNPGGAANGSDAERDSSLSASGWLREIAIGSAVGLPLAGIAAAFRAWVAPNYRLPTPADQAVQTAFYLAINAPAEELFWRGTVQDLTTRGLRHLPRLGRVAPVLGWAFATATYAGYHRLGNWSWRSIAGVAAAGALFGWLYEARPRDRALVAPTIAHGLATAGFLSWGDVLLHRMALRRLERRFGPLRAWDGAQSKPERRADALFEEQAARDE